MFAQKWTRLPVNAQSGVRLPVFAKKWTRLPGKPNVRTRLPRPQFCKNGSGYLVGPDYLVLHKSGPDYLVAAKSGPDYLVAVSWAEGGGWRASKYGK